jgi:membrane protease subunit HflK
VNSDNQNDQDPWGRKNQDDISFDDLIKKFSVMFSKQTSSGSNGSSGNNGMSFPTKKTFLYGFFGLLVIYASMCVYQLDSPERAVILRFGEYHEETGMLKMLPLQEDIHKQRICSQKTRI